MPDYSTGKIYKIINPQNEVIYIGSTIQKLSQRFCKHDHKGNGNKIILLENYPCNSREELCMKEQEHIESYENLLNQFRAFNSEDYNKEYFKEYQKVYREENKNKLSQYRKVYTEENKDKISERKKIYYENNKEFKKLYRETNKDKIKEIKQIHYKNNKDKIIEKAKVYYEENKNKISEKRKVKLICECGCETTKNHILRHKQSKKHIKLMESKKN